MKKQLLYKIRFIFLPFLWIAAGFMLVYTTLDWWLVMRPCSFWISEELVFFGLPFALPCIPVLIWLRPRIKCLKMNTKNVIPYVTVATFAIGGMTIAFLRRGYGNLASMDMCAL